MPDIKMPEISGIKGGLGAAGGAGIGDVSRIGFSMPEIEVFGEKSRGGKVFLILDSSAEIMNDELGGIAGYTLIKNELVKIFGNLPSTTLFNIAVFNRNQTFILFPGMVAANEANVDRVDTWIDSLNKVHARMGTNQYGPSTLGAGGRRVDEKFLEGKLQRSVGWYRPSAEAMRQQADSIFLLGSVWGVQWHHLEEYPDWSASARKKWEESYQKGLKLLEQENKERIAKGQPPRVVRKDAWDVELKGLKELKAPSAESHPSNRIEHLWREVWGITYK